MHVSLLVGSVGWIAIWNSVGWSELKSQWNSIRGKGGEVGGGQLFQCSSQFAPYAMSAIFLWKEMFSSFQDICENEIQNLCPSVFVYNAEGGWMESCFKNKLMHCCSQTFHFLCTEWLSINYVTIRTLAINIYKMICSISLLKDVTAALSVWVLWLFLCWKYKYETLERIFGRGCT